MTLGFLPTIFSAIFMASAKSLAGVQPTSRTEPGPAGAADLHLGQRIIHARDTGHNDLISLVEGILALIHQPETVHRSVGIGMPVFENEVFAVHELFLINRQLLHGEQLR